MDFNEGLNFLANLCKGKDWFAEVGTDQYGRFVVYVNFMCHETLHNIPDTVAGKQVLVHFIASKTATREQFVETPGPKPSIVSEFIQKAKEAQAQGIDVGVGQMLDELDVGSMNTEELSMRHLEDELDRLEKMCGSNCLQDIFYEIRDGRNAVTNHSTRYPEVRTRLEKLYNEYGFDVIYESLDG